jgi:thioredoxin reductase
MYDVVIVGGGPAGESAALILARCRRRVVVVDSGRPRNAAAVAMHGFLSRDGTPPAEMSRLGRDELRRYGVEWVHGLAVSANCSPRREGTGQSAFEVKLEDGREFIGRKLLLATGVIDVLPEIEGVGQFYGQSVHHCPYCDGWEHRDEVIAALGEGSKAVGLALNLLTWSRRVVACTEGGPVDAALLERAAVQGIAVREERVVRLEGEGRRLRRLIFEGGEPLKCAALFFNTGHYQRSMLPAGLGCEYDDAGHVVTHDKQRTRQKGFFLAGDADGDVQFVIIAAAEGARAAVGINRELQEEDIAAAG